MCIDMYVCVYVTMCAGVGVGGVGVNLAGTD